MNYFVIIRELLAGTLAFFWKGRRVGNQRLPHTAEFNDLPAREAVNRLQADPARDVILARSKGFWFGESKWLSVSDAYVGYFEKKKGEFRTVLGDPVFDGHWTSDAYPVFGVGDTITVWGTGKDAIYLRCFQEDRETGFEVSLLTPLSPNSNHEPVSIYTEIRKLTPS